MAVTHARIAHRGFAAIAEENSLTAIERAITRGCDLVEVDVRRRRDGAIVLHHDSGSTHGAPLLDDALDRIAASTSGVMLDVKETGLADEITLLLDRHKLRGLIVASGEPGEARRIKQLRSGVLAGRTWPIHTAPGRPALDRVLVEGGRLPLRLALGRIVDGFDVLVAYHPLLTAAIVSACHRRRVLVYAWTVDEPKRVAKLLADGVDGIIADHPESLAL